MTVQMLGNDAVEYANRIANPSHYKANKKYTFDPLAIKGDAKATVETKKAKTGLLALAVVGVGLWLAVKQ